MFNLLDSTRIKILNMLEKPMTTTELAEKLKLTKATISHHLKVLQRLNLVKVQRVELERNFLKKYYISTLTTPNPLIRQEKNIFRDFRPSKDEYFRVVLRMLSILNLKHDLFLRKIGRDVGYHLFSDQVEGNVIDGTADLWEKLGLGNVVEATDSSFKVEDCYICAGLPEIGGTYCKIDEGIIEGILLKKTGRRYMVREVNCWGTGDEYCLFKIKSLPKGGT